MRFNSKNTNYHSRRADRGVFINPYVVTTGTTIDTENNVLTVNFALKFDSDGMTKTLERASLTFTAQGVDTLIEDANGNDVEITAFLMGGGTYDVNKITQWGTPSFTSVQAYFELSSVWNDLQFKDTPFKQLAIDWVLNNLKIEGVLIKENFELVV